MGQAESKFVPRPCRRCGAVVVAGEHGGCLMRVDLGVQPGDAIALHHYGHPVLWLLHRHTGLWPADYDPDRAPPERAYLAAAHVCGSEHSRQLMEGKTWNTL